jgi:hypothetical protein
VIPVKSEATKTVPRCSFCGGSASMKRHTNGFHYFCEARAKHGLPTPSLGDDCSVCDGAKTLGKGGVMLSFDEGPARIARSIAAQFPPCEHCKGSGIEPGTLEGATFSKPGSAQLENGNGRAQS